MATAPGLIPIEEYMHISYSPDCEYIDGVIVERNVGLGKHSFTQGEVLARLWACLASGWLIRMSGAHGFLNKTNRLWK